MGDVYDVIVVGAGPGGAVAAAFMAEWGLDVLLVDKFNFPRDKTCGDGLTPRALAVLARMGLLDDLLPLGYRSRQMVVQAPNGRSITADFPAVRPEIDYMLVTPRLVLDRIILERALAAGATFRRLRVNGVAPDSTGVTITGSNRGRTATLRAQAVVLATGANVKLLLQMGLLRRQPQVTLAARAYFKDIQGLNPRIQFYFEGVPLPGYGWIFPLSDTSANVGAGYFPRRWFTRGLPSTPGKAFDDFIHTPAIRSLLGDARMEGPVKGYPLRTDFAAAPTFGRRVLLVGEAAGLVNPLTGEGIDYALESGQIAGRHLVSLFAAGSFLPQDFAAYDRLLRERFQTLFLFCSRVRGLCLNQASLNWLVKWAVHRPDLKDRLVEIVLGNRPLAANSLSPKNILRAVLFPYARRVNKLSR